MNKNIIGWMTTYAALVMNLTNINNILTIVISIASLAFIGFKIYGQILENRIKKKELEK